jgi:lysozyme
MNYDKAKKLIKKYETFKPEPYYATDYEKVKGILTIGYGFTQIDNRNVKLSDYMDENQADELLTTHINEIHRQIASEISGLTENEYTALISLVFNIGFGAFKNSTLLRKIRSNERLTIEPDQKLHNALIEFAKRKDYKEVTEISEFHRWTTQSGVYLYGLFRRREEEWQIYKKKTSLT